MSSKELSRRKFLTLSAFTAAGAALAACTQSASPTSAPTTEATSAVSLPTTVPPTEPPANAPTATQVQAPPQPTPPPASYKQSPMLDAMNDLPPVEERLPENPKVITPIDEIGQYGGTLRRGTVNISGYLLINQAHEPLFEFPYPFLNSGPVEPNLAETWEFNEDGTELTVYLRQGIKWSDGEPFTAADVMFLWEDVWRTEEALTPAPSASFVDGEPVQLEMVDDFTLKFTFSRSNFYSLTNFASMAEWAWPRHYMEEFHPKYNTAAKWEDFPTHVNWQDGRGKVTLQAWMLDTYQADRGVTMVRNPYYWKVDTEGNQLPYIDNYNWEIVQDRPTIALKLVAGEYDVDGMWVGIPQIPLFTAEQPARGFRLGWYEHVEAWAIYMNYDYADETIRNTLRDINFRRALSHAINRDEINRTFYFDLLNVNGTCFSAATPFYDEQCKEAYTQYDPEESMRLLDEAGIVDVDGDGVREAADGKKLQLVFDVYQHDLYVPLMELAVEWFKEVGLDVVLNIQLQDATFQRRQTNDFMFTVGDFDSSNQPIEGAASFAPVAPNTPFWHKQAPTDPVSPEYTEFAEILTTATGLEREEMIDRVTEANLMLAENVWILSGGDMKRPYFIGKGIYNVPEAAYRIPADTPPLRPYQIYINREE